MAFKEVYCKSCGKPSKVPLSFPEPFYCCALPFKNKVFNFTTTVVEYAKSGFKNDEVKQKDRLEICQACELYDNGKCTSCGCNLKVKTLWEISKCPLNRW